MGGIDDAIGSGASQLIQFYGPIAFFAMVFLAGNVAQFLMAKSERHNWEEERKALYAEIKNEVKTGRDFAEAQRKEFANGLELLERQMDRAPRRRDT